jgi:glycosyltransferase involved in cell wall biosynthesis
VAAPTFLIISQVYVPDPAAVGQHMASAAEAIAARGFRVIVYTSARGYDSPTTKYPRRETINGVEVRRLHLSSLGKSSIGIRLLAQCIFLSQVFLRALVTRNLQGILVSTSPPFCGIVGALLSWVRGVPLKYWLMDLNPDQVIAFGSFSANGLPARVFDFFNRCIFRQATDIVVLDRFMLERIKQKGVAVEHKTTIAPPWPQVDDQILVPHNRNPFRAAHGLGTSQQDKFVVMYSGNHSPANPLKTLLDAADRLRDEPKLLFCFVGGGVGKREIDERIAAGATNLVSVPYQPLDQIQYSLSAADVHVVSVGDNVVGIVHPCKVYGAMAVRRPILLLGPDPCHVSDLIDEHGIGWHIPHGDVDRAVRTLRQILRTSEDELQVMGERAQAVIQAHLSKHLLCEQFTDVMLRGIQPQSPRRISQPCPGGTA